ncbi:uncharacterized protein LOC125662238 [Ostrea edulis]|uniref:uncharacterized protein LOC125662238 n=1 Tax=Ostrea edulis TaxID=37623 RepID=UPI002094EA6E|nr:uncharacterized protein LOC125662238 [Ostrea edulis]
MKIQLYSFCVLSTLLSLGYGQPWSANLGLGTGNKGPELKLTVGHKSGNWNFKGWGSTNFGGGWKAGVSVGIRFKRSTNDVPRKFSILIQANQCHFNSYDDNLDDFITLEEMTNLFENPEFGSQLFYDLDINKGDGRITKEEFDEMAPLVINGCASY